MLLVLAIPKRGLFAFFSIEMDVLTLVSLASLVWLV